MIEEPARLVAPASAACQTQVQNAANTLVNGKVKLPTDAFELSPTLPLSRILRDDQGRDMLNKETAGPVAIRLVVRGGQCILTHIASQKQVAVTGCSCQANK